LTVGVIAAIGLTAPLAFASHYEASLEGSNFEIDNNANFLLDHNPAGAWLDWINVAEVRATDVATGQNDNSYQGGTKEDTVCPSTTTGSIPNNKSDLKAFGVYVEPGTSPGDPGYLHLFWTRVSDPSGTTLMDFEFNQSGTSCAVGVNKTRTINDLLIEYSIDQGGARANITVRKWTGSAWGPADAFDPTEATGTINLTPILAANTAGVSTETLQARTFGEASIDLDAIFQEDKCTSFGAAMLKSRSSDAFSSQLKDFIAPASINLSNCAQVIIRKQTVPDGATTLFDYTKSFATDPATGNTFDLADDESQSFTNVLLGANYTVTEGAVPPGWVFDRVDCSASTGVTPDSITGPTVTFDLDSVADILDCTYYNEEQRGAIKVTKTRKHAADGSGDHPHAGVNFTVNGVTKATDSNGVACFDGLLFDSYAVHESVPAGYVGEADKNVVVDSTATCAGDPYAGESVAFHNTPLTNVTVSVDSQVAGGTASTISCVDAANAVKGSGSTGADGDGSVLVSNLVPTAPGTTLVCTIIVDP
jgi:hypothetical protein